MFKCIFHKIGLTESCVEEYAPAADTSEQLYIWGRHNMDRGQCKFHQDLTKNRLIFVSGSECYPPREIQGSCDEYSLNVCHPVVFYIKNVTNKILSTVGSIIQVKVFACEAVQFGSHVPMFWATSNLRAHECSTLKTEA